MKKMILGALRRILRGINFVCVKLQIAKPTLDPSEAGGYWHPTTRRHIELARFIRECGVPVDASILDVGCGPGGLIERLVKSGYRNIRGCDWRDVRFDRFEYQVIDLNAEGLKAYADNSFDAIVCSDVLEHLENPASMLREFRRVIRPGGDLFITLPSCWNVYERLYFFLTGNSHRYKSERVAAAWGHISMLPTDVLESLTDRAHLELDRSEGGYVYFFGHFWFRSHRPIFAYNLMYHYVVPRA